jgi:hypothetical protein
MKKIWEEKRAEVRRMEEERGVERKYEEMLG